jgi:excisionase family DNA binding protein
MTKTVSAAKASAGGERHLTIAEVCEELNITRSTFYDWRAKRKAPRCFKLANGEVRIRRSDFDTWLSSLDEAEAA